MGVNARFTADFSDFQTAVAKAEISLRGFEDQSAKVERSLNRMTDQFSGRKLIEEATLMTRVLGSSADIALLTGKELQQAGNKAAEAAEKMRKLGIEVPPGLQRIADAAQAADTSTNKWSAGLSKLNGLLGALGISVSIGAVVAFGKALLADADALVKLSDKTGLSIEGLQRLQIAGDDAGNTIEQITAAVTMMEKRIAGGDQSAVKGLQALNLSFEDFAKLTPENQWNAIAKAISGVEDPAQRVLIATELFGKQGAEILPSLLKSYEMLKDGATVMSDETVRAWDSAGDALARWWRITKGVTSEAIVQFVHMASAGFDPAAVSAENVVRQLEALQREMAKLASSVPKAKIDIFDPSVELKGLALDHVIRDLDADNAKLVASQRRANEEQIKAADAERKHEEALFKLLQTQLDSVQGFSDLKLKTLDLKTALEQLGTVEAAPVYKNFGNQLHEINAGAKLSADQMRELAAAGRDASEALAHIPAMSKLPVLTSSIHEAKEEAVSFGEKARSALDSIDKILSNIPGKFAEIGAVAARTGMAIMDSLAKGNILGAITAGVVGGIQVIKSLFGGVSQAEKDARKGIQEFEAQLASTLSATQKLEAGGKSWAMTTIAVRDAYLKTGHSAAEAEAAVIRLWGSSKQGADAAKKAIDEINAVLDEQKQDAADLEAAVQRYGFSIEELGPAMQRQKLDEQAQQLLNDWRLLVGSGIDLTLVNQKMAGSVQEYLNMALKTGMEVPIAMKPILQSMIDQGTLVDENGVAITDLGQLGVTFSESMTQGFAKIVAKLQELLDKIGMVPAALNAIPTSRDIDVNVNYHDNGPPDRRQDESYASQGGLVTPAGVMQYLAGGGNVLPWRPRGTDKVPAMLTPGERVLSVAQNKAFMAGGGGNGDMSAAVDSLRESVDKRDRAQARQMDALPDQLAIAVAAALAKSQVRRR